MKFDVQFDDHHWDATSGNNFKNLGADAFEMPSGREFGEIGVGTEAWPYKLIQTKNEYHEWKRAMESYLGKTCSKGEVKREAPFL